MEQKNVKMGTFTLMSQIWRGARNAPQDPKRAQRAVATRFRIWKCLASSAFRANRVAPNFFVARHYQRSSSVFSLRLSANFLRLPGQFFAARTICSFTRETG